MQRCKIRVIAWKPIRSTINSRTSSSAQRRSGGIFDYAGKKDRLEEVNRELENPDVWNKPANAQALGRERAQLQGIVGTLERVAASLQDSAELLQLAIEEQDQETLDSVKAELDRIEADPELLAALLLAVSTDRIIRSFRLSDETVEAWDEVGDKVVSMPVKMPTVERVPFDPDLEVYRYNIT